MWKQIKLGIQTKKRLCESPTSNTKLQHSACPFHKDKHQQLPTVTQLQNQLHILLITVIEHTNGTKIILLEWYSFSIFLKQNCTQCVIFPVKNFLWSIQK